jgi:hypothetical protein
MKRFNPYKLADNLIESNYRIPIMGNVTMGDGDSFMTTAPDNSINLAEYLEFMRKTIYGLQKEIELYSEYHKAAHKIKDTSSRSEYQEGCRDTFGAGFFLERDEYKPFRDIYWKIQKLKTSKA